MTRTENTDLDALAAQHALEETEETALLVSSPRPQKTILPADCKLAKSEYWLERLYAQERVVREKKPGVLDHLRSQGPWMVSVDEPPLSVTDGMTQTATLVGGFAEDRVVKGYVEGEFDGAILFADDTSVVESSAAQSFREILKRLVPGLPHVTFANSGAESVEKALALSQLNRAHESQKRVLAFEGSFHGRTLLALHASYNPKKRAPFEFAGFEVTYAPFPTWWTPHAPEPKVSLDYLKAVANADFDQAKTFCEDELAKSELDALRIVAEHLQTNNFHAVIVEPMQSEGGDRYVTARFHRALRVLTRALNVSLVVDEVQCGFGLGGTFTWHSGFGYTDLDGQPDYPDCVTFAKRAQTGVVMSRFEDPEPTSANPASLVRGRMHAEMMADDPFAKEIAGWVGKHLCLIAGEFPELVSFPRNRGYAVAFDLPSTDHLMAYLGQRFWRGTVVFGAGTKTVRYRLSNTYTEADVDRLFESVNASLDWLKEHPGEKAPTWQNAFEVRDTVVSTAHNVTLRRAEPGEKEALLDAIMALEKEVYEPARQDPREHLGKAFNDGGVVVVAEESVDGETRVVGTSLGAPLEDFANIKGPDQDPFLGKKTTLYSIATTITPDQRGRGLGRSLKQKLIEIASERYAHVAGRNRLGEAAAMMRINRAFGAYQVARIDGAYDGEGQCLYYRLPTAEFVPSSAPAPSGAAADFSQGLSRPLRHSPESLVSALNRGQLYGPTVSKVTVMNYVTPAIVRAIEWVDALLPNHPHLYLTSSRDETFDKSVRILRYHRKQAQVVLGLEGGYVGHTTAAARSLSDPAVHRQGPGYFEKWARVPHPADGVDITIKALRDHVAQHGSDAIAGVYVEPVQERTGRVLDDVFLSALSKFREDTGIPVVFVETATACYRSGRGPFFCSTGDFVPDLVTWWAGAQIGFVHVTKDFFVSTPLTMVSTWDGDELSLVRVHHQLRRARELSLAEASSALQAAVPGAKGMGLYRVLQCSAEEQASVKSAGINAHTLPNHALAFAPTLDVTQGELEELGAALVQARS